MAGAPRAYPLKLQLATAGLWLLLASWNQANMAAAEPPPGFTQVDGRYISLTSDLPADTDLQSLIDVFDAAMPMWCSEFDVDLADVGQWKVDAYLMQSRQRFLNNGMLPNDLPQFPHGFQWGNQVWVAEQATDYYRRHLLLHEGTHWFMNRKFGSNGPPWLMEGYAEWFATHRWDGQDLELGIIPKSKSEVPNWGRISLIQEQLTGDLAPSLETVLRYDTRTHVEPEAYAWSWAAVLLMKHHPQTQAAFRAMLEQPMRPDSRQTSFLFRRLRNEWPELRQSWNALLAELEYGYDPSRGLLTFAKQSQSPTTAPQTLAVRADQSWQSSGIHALAGTSLRIEASGQYTVGQAPRPWRCEPAGVTLEYYQRRPLGQLSMLILAPLEEEPALASAPSVIAVGEGGELTVQHNGEVFFRVNEASSGLADNSGEITVTIHQ